MAAVAERLPGFQKCFVFTVIFTDAVRVPLVRQPDHHSVRVKTQLRRIRAVAEQHNSSQKAVVRVCLTTFRR